MNIVDILSFRVYWISYLHISLIDIGNTDIDYKFIDISIMYVDKRN